MEFVKLYSTMLESSIWEEDQATRLVWITLLLKMDASGFVKCSGVERLAMLANVPVEQALAAVEKLESPDPISPGQEHDGRRIEQKPGGWLVLNGAKYLMASQRENWRLAKQAQRAREKLGKRQRTSGSLAERQAVSQEAGPGV